MSLDNLQVEIRNYLKDLNKENVRENILKGFAKTPKQISPRFFYDKKGSELFEEITKLEEYYPSEAEKGMLSTVIDKLDLKLQDLSIIELGSGDSSKISLLFQQLSAESLKSITYYPMDVSQTAIEKSAKNLLTKFPLKAVVGVVADFTQQMDKLVVDGKKLFCFLGSTIGNFTEEKTNDLMQKIGAEMNEGDYLLIGADIIKEKAVMEAAYNDAKGVTAAFNKNILNVVNENIDSNFKTSDFTHLAFYNEEKKRIEMHLQAMRAIKVVLKDSNENIYLAKGERIHTENSHKFNLSRLAQIGKAANLKIKQFLMAENKGFSLVLYEK